VYVCVFATVMQDGSTMLMEAAKGGHFETMSLLLDWPASHNTVSASSDAASHSNKVRCCFPIVYTHLAGKSICIRYLTLVLTLW